MIPQNPNVNSKEKSKENVSRETLINIDAIEPNKKSNLGSILMRKNC